MYINGIGIFQTVNPLTLLMQSYSHYNIVLYSYLCFWVNCIISQVIIYPKVLKLIVSVSILLCFAKHFQSLCSL